MAKSDPNAEKGLSDLLQHGLKDIYYAEKKIYKSLPKMIKAADDQGLKACLTDHREETAEQISKLEEIFELMGLRAKAQKCDAIDGIIEEGDGILEDFGGTPAGDAAIIFSSQAIEHYEMTRYGSMHAFAMALGMKDVGALLQEILGQEKAADKKLSALAVDRVNFAAGSGDNDESDGDAMRRGGTSAGKTDKSVTPPRKTAAR